MSLLDSLRKGLGFLLLSFGVSSPAKKPRTTSPPAPKPDDGKPLKGRGSDETEISG